MKRWHFLCFLCSVYVNAQPLRLHPENSHYFEFQGKPTVLIASSIHYGAVLNRDVDYDIYLEVLHQYGFNLHREFLEPCYDFSRTIDWQEIQTPLSPRPGKLIVPWARSDEPGYINGGNKFNLDRWNENYFHRLKDFCQKAGQKQMMVEIVLFNVMYSDDNWNYSALNSKNNVNGIGNGRYNDYNFIKEPALFDKQKDLARKVVEELNELDNVYYEICNEPYWAKGIPEINPDVKEQLFLPEVKEWQREIVQVIVNTEKNLPKHHLIAENIANTYFKVDSTCHPDVSILNFHYAWPPTTVLDNYALNKPVAFDETAQGCNAPDRRPEAWAFLLAGGAVYNNLDWSFAIDDMTGRGRNPAGHRQSGMEVRRQLGILKQFMESLDFVNMTPVDSSFIRELPLQVDSYGLIRKGEDYAVYFIKRKKTEVAEIDFPLPPGSYRVRWIDPIDGAILEENTISHKDENVSVKPPRFSDDVLLRVTKIKVL